MKKCIFIAIVLTVLLLVAGCGGSPQAEADITGLIFSVDENRVLIVADIETVDMPYEEWFEQGNRAIWFTIGNKTKIQFADGKKATASDLKEGQKVEAWTDGATMKSYPEQAGAQKIVITSR
jgi:outer membrane lipoprotein-sorting protein